MEVIKIAPQNISKTVWLDSYLTVTTRLSYKVKTGKIAINPKSIVNKAFKGKFHVIFVEGGISYFNCLFNQMLVYFDYNLGAFKNIVIVEGILSFETDFGKYSSE
jgi:hypothetical protein